MKQILLILISFLCIGFVSAQGNLDGIVLEKYYVTDAADGAASSANAGGVLTVGSVAYRLYVDMAPGYELISVYGENTPASNKIDPLIIKSTAKFYNHNDRGQTFAYDISNTQLPNNTVLLDSWLTTGRVSTALYQGQLKTDDTNGSLLSGSSVYNNTAGGIGIAVKIQDGLTATGAASIPWAVSPGTGPLVDAIFGTANPPAPDSLLLTDNSLGITGGSLVGPAGSGNRVLIGQFTTAGFLSYKLNVIIRQVGTTNIEEWVAETPQAGQFTHSSLTRVQNVFPTVTINAPLGGASYTAGQTINVSATANDANGTISKVDFLYNGIRVSDTSGPNPYTASFTAANGVSLITARAFDNAGDSTSATVNIIVGANPAPTVTLGAIPAPSYIDSTVVLTATASDGDGIAMVQFLVNGVVVGAGTFSAPNVYTFTYSTAGKAKGTYTVAARATDALGGVTTTGVASLVLLNLNGNVYEVREVTAKCNEENICVPIAAQQDVEDIIGFDIVLHYNVNKVVPTGIIRKSADLAPLNLVETSYSIPSAGKMLIAVYFNSNAPVTSRFEGLGDIICVEFEKRPAFLANDNVEFTVEPIRESYISGVQIEPCDTNSYITYKDTLFTSNLEFWADNSPIAYVAGTNLITNIFGTSNSSCDAKSVTSVTPDVNGEFTHNLNKGLYLSIERDIADLTDVQPAINGFDALQVRKVLLEDQNLVPNIYQMIAMDVNLDGRISAGDASQINQRAVGIIDEFRQAWNYNDDGTKIVGEGDSKDWLFVDASRLQIYPEYIISANYPRYDGIGYNKDHVPTLDFCNPTPVSDWTRCAVIGTETYVGILIGDANGNYKSIAPSTDLRSAEKVVLNVGAAVITGNMMDIPVSFNSAYSINAIDLAIQYDNNKVVFNTLVSDDNEIQMLGNFNTNDNILRVTSNSLNTLSSENSNFSIRFELLDNRVDVQDFTGIAGYLNGEKVNIEILDSPTATKNEFDSNSVLVYPNPANNTLFVESKEQVTAQLFDVNGKTVVAEFDVEANSKSAFDISNLPNGVYMLKLSNVNFTSSRKVIIAE